MSGYAAQKEFRVGGDDKECKKDHRYIMEREDLWKAAGRQDTAAKTMGLIGEQECHHEHHHEHTHEKNQHTKETGIQQDGS